MPRGLLGRKIGMTQVFGEGGGVIPVTVIEAGPCVVLQVRTPDRDGYSAVQLGFGDKKRSRARKTERGHVAVLQSKRTKSRQAAGVELIAKPDCEPKKFVREFRTEDVSDSYDVGQVLTVQLFAEMPFVDVIGTTKGRGTAGAMKRHNYSGQRASHGVKKVHRHVGSIGQSSDPSRVFKGTRMAGHYGHSQVTVRRLKVVRVDEEKNLLLICGAVPGPNGGYLLVRETNCV